MTARFELLSQLGKGGMGTVWKARDTSTGEIIALKLLHEQHADDPYFVERFEREVEVTQRIASPYVARTLGFGQREGRPYIAMEYVEGKSLRDIVRERSHLPWGEAKGILRQVALGLDAAHSAGVIHRDVKPSNILVTPEGTAKLLDFGIARALDLTAMTGTSTMMGTPAYMPPEGKPSAQADLYGLGCMAYEMLTGSPPFVGDSQAEVVVRHIREAPDLSRLPAEARPVLVGSLRRSRRTAPEVPLRSWPCWTVARRPTGEWRQEREGMEIARGGGGRNCWGCSAAVRLRSSRSRPVYRCSWPAA